MKIEITEKELKKILLCLVLEEGAQKFRRGLAEAKEEEIELHNLFDKLIKFIKK